jgi:hypothetical protein
MKQLLYRLKCINNVKDYYTMRLDILESERKELAFQHYLQTGRFPD